MKCDILFYTFIVYVPLFYFIIDISWLFVIHLEQCTVGSYRCSKRLSGPSLSQLS